MMEKEEAIQKRVSMLRNIEEGELKHLHRKSSSEDVDYRNFSFASKHFGSIDERNKGQVSILARKNSVVLDSLAGVPNTEKNEKKKLGLKSKTFRNNLRDIEKFIPKSLNHKMFESQTYFNVLSNCTIK